MLQEGLELKASEGESTIAEIKKWRTEARHCERDFSRSYCVRSKVASVFWLLSISIPITVFASTW